MDRTSLRLAPRSLRMCMYIILMILISIYLIVIIYNEHENKKIVTHFQNVNLGDTQDQVRKKLGNPTNENCNLNDINQSGNLLDCYVKKAYDAPIDVYNSRSVSKNDSRDFSSDEYMRHITIYYRKNMVVGVFCGEGNKSKIKCDKISGMGVGDSEKLLLDYFGKPSHIATNDEWKIIYYKKYNVNFITKNQKILAITMLDNQYYTIHIPFTEKP